MSSYLLTGGLGFIGRNLTQRLISIGLQPLLIVREGQENLVTEGAIPLTMEELEHYLSSNEVSNVINLAGFYSQLDDLATTSKLVESNILFPLHIAVLLKSNKQKPHWVQASSFMQHMNSHESNPSCLYAATKQCTVELLKFFENHGFCFSDIVLPHVYGENDGRGKLLEQLVSASVNRQSIALSSGRQIMDLVHISDVINAIISISISKSHGRFQLTSSAPLTIRELVELINSLTPTKLQVTFDESLDRERDTYEPWVIAPKPDGWTDEISIDQWLREQLNEL